jgi:hypothetical protein
MKQKLQERLLSSIQMKLLPEANAFFLIKL